METEEDSLAFLLFFPVCVCVVKTSRRQISSLIQLVFMTKTPNELDKSEFLIFSTFIYLRAREGKFVEEK